MKISNRDLTTSNNAVWDYPRQPVSAAWTSPQKVIVLLTQRRGSGVLMRRCPLVCDVEAHSKSTNARFAATSEDWGAQAIDLQLEPVQQVFRLANNEVSPAKRMRLSDAEA